MAKSIDKALNSKFTLLNAHRVPTLTVPKDYNHATQVQIFAKEFIAKYGVYNINIFPRSLLRGVSMVRYSYYGYPNKQIA